MFTNRQRKILETILINTQGIKGAEIAKKIDVSSRTIRNDIAQINSILDAHEHKIRSSNKIGYFINQQDEQFFRNEFSDQSLEKHDKELEGGQRAQRILARCLFEGDLDYYDLGEEFHVSQQTIYKNIHTYNEMLIRDFNFRDLEFRSESLSVKSSEEKIRELLFKLLSYSIHTKNANYINELRILLDDNFLLEEYEDLKKAVIHALSTEYITLHDKALFTIVSSLYISMKRNQFGYELKYESDMKRLRFEKSVPNDFMSQIIGAGFDLKLMDQAPIGDLIWGMKLSNKSSNVNSISNLTENVMSDFTFQILEKYGINLSTTQKLSTSLKTHIEYLLRRMDYGYRVENPLLEDIKTRYINAYEVSILIAHIIYRYKGEYPTDSEISYVAMYIEYYLQTRNQKLKTVIVYDSSFAFNSIVESWLRNNFSDSLQVVEGLPLYLLDEYLSKHSVDLIVSIRKPNLPLDHVQYNIDHIPGSKDYDLIKNLIHKLITGSKYEKTVRNMFSLEFIEIYEQEENFESLILKMANDLKDKDLIRNASEFTADVIGRESHYPTLIENGIAILHPLSTFASKSRVSVAILDTPIWYRGEAIQIVFLMAIKSKLDYDVNKIFHFTKQLLSNKKVLEELKSLRTREEFLDRLIYYSKNLQLLSGNF